jgi:hypothetical protein
MLNLQVTIVRIDVPPANPSFGFRKTSSLLTDAKKRVEKTAKKPEENGSWKQKDCDQSGTRTHATYVTRKLRRGDIKANRLNLAP